MKSLRKWITINQFKQIKIDDILTIRFFVNKAKVVSISTKRERVKVVFLTGPMKNKGEIMIIRQQIKSIKN